MRVAVEIECDLLSGFGEYLDLPRVAEQGQRALFEPGIRLSIDCDGVGKLAVSLGSDDEFISHLPLGRARHVDTRAWGGVCRGNGSGFFLGHLSSFLRRRHRDIGLQGGWQPSTALSASDQW